VRLQAQFQGAARFQRTEGLWLTEHDAFICATSGGPLDRGQVFRLGLDEGGVLEVLAEAGDLRELDMPDNVCVSPHGVLFVAEDGYDGNFVRTITPEGKIAPFARNARSQTEFAGPCFSPDGGTLFVNLQEEGLTLAIQGPFEEEA
jgi:secreted PhoX family phosphatase